MWTVNSVAGPIIFAQAERSEGDLLCAIGALIGVLALGYWAIAKVKKWREETAEEVGPTSYEQLDHFQQMVDEGQLDPEEFARIKAQLDAKALPPEHGNDDPPKSEQPPDTSIRES
ncbi:MAG TPA: hypothetical protein VFE62_23215 [Gemmataceae bacterium]|nr:hypothetical protein [Gemmataceae bacterium]